MGERGRTRVFTHQLLSVTGDRLVVHGRWGVLSSSARLVCFTGQVCPSGQRKPTADRELQVLAEGSGEAMY